MNGTDSGFVTLAEGRWITAVLEDDDELRAVCADIVEDAAVERTEVLEEAEAADELEVELPGVVCTQAASSKAKTKERGFIRGERGECSTRRTTVVQYDHFSFLNMNAFVTRSVSAVCFVLLLLPLSASARPVGEGVYERAEKVVAAMKKTAVHSAVAPVRRSSRLRLAVERQRKSERAMRPAVTVKKRLNKDDIVTKEMPAVILPGDHVRGDAAAPVSLIEYVDIECPFCQRHHAVMQQLLDEYAGRVNWVYRPYPLEFHTHARKAALTAECVAEAGGNTAFWQYLDMLMTGADLSTNSLLEKARSTGVDKKIIQSCVDREVHADVLAAALKQVEIDGVSGTPSTLVVHHASGKQQMMPGALPIESLRTAIDALLGTSSAK